MYKRNYCRKKCHISLWSSSHGLVLGQVRKNINIESKNENDETKLREEK